MLIPSILYAFLHPLTLISLAINKVLNMTAPRELTDMEGHLKRGKGILGKLKDVNASKTARTDWMGSLPNERPLSQLSVPGTHDSAAYNFIGQDQEFWNCQDMPLLDQLEAGIRAFDLRYGIENGKLLFYHATALLDENAEVVDIIWGLHAWLKKHKRETIFVSLKVDNKRPEAEDVQAAMEKVLDETSAFWVTNVTTQTTLESARGKLVPVRRFPFSREFGFDVSNNWKRNNACFSMPLKQPPSVARVEDFYLLQGYPCNAHKQIEIKKGYTIEHLEKAQAALAESPQDLYITFSSAVGDREKSSIEDVTPRVMALGRDGIPGMNQHLIEWCNGVAKSPVGIVFMDFVDIEPSIPLQGEETSSPPPQKDLIRLFIEMQK